MLRVFDVSSSVYENIESRIHIPTYFFISTNKWLMYIVNTYVQYIVIICLNKAIFTET